MKSLPNSKAICLLLIPVGIFSGLYFVPGVELSERHYYVFPLTVAILFYLFFRSFRASFLGIAAVLPMMFFGARYVFSFSVESSYPGVVVASLQKDPKEAKSTH